MVRRNWLRPTRVLQAGPERSAQVNYGARQASGAYLYRIDGDFELDPAVIAACVEAIEQGGYDAISVPNRSQGTSYWAHVRTLERDTYLDDKEITAARFWRREAFEAVDGFDESLVSCEDYDLHNRLVARGCKIGGVTPGEIHLGEADHLWDYAAQSFYYGPSAFRYIRKHPQRGARQLFPVRAAYVRHRRQLVAQPGLLVGLVILKIVQYIAATTGILAQGLGLTGAHGRLLPNPIAGLALVLAALWVGMAACAHHLGFTISPLAGVAISAGGLALWQLVGRRRARRLGLPLSTAISQVALAFAPLLTLILVQLPEWRGVPPEAWSALLSFAFAWWAGLLIYLAGVSESEWARKAALPLLAVGIAAFVAAFGFRSVAMLRVNGFGAYDLAVVDQALWGLVHGQGLAASPANLLYSSIYGRSFFASDAAPILLAFAPAYAAGLGGPMLLLLAQSLALGVAAIGLYRLSTPAIGRTPGLLVALAYLGYFLTLRAGAFPFHAMTIAVPLVLFALDAYRRRELALYYLLLVLTLACGADWGLAVAGLGVYLLVGAHDRRHGLITTAAGVLWTWVAVTAFIPFFGGAAGQAWTAYSAIRSEPALAAGRLFNSETLRYLAMQLGPLGLTPLLATPLLLPALPQLLLSILAGGQRYTGLYGWQEVLIVPFLFVAAMEGLRWLGSRAGRRGWAAPYLAGSVGLIVGCLTLTLLPSPGIPRELSAPPVTAHSQLGQAILTGIATDSSAAVQSPSRSRWPIVGNSRFYLRWRMPISSFSISFTRAARHPRKSTPRPFSGPTATRSTACRPRRTVTFSSNTGLTPATTVRNWSRKRSQRSRILCMRSFRIRSSTWASMFRHSKFTQGSLSTLHTIGKASNP